MLHLIFRIGSERYAISATEIQAVLAVPELEPVALAPDHVAGLFRYEDEFIPVLDLCLLRHSIPARRVLSTRVILVTGADGSRLGLLVEQALEMMELTDGYLLDTGIAGTGRDWLNERVYGSEGGLIQRVHWPALLTPELQGLACAKV